MTFKGRQSFLQNADRSGRLAGQAWQTALSSVYSPFPKGNPQKVRYLDSNGWLISLFVFMGFVFAGMGTAFWLAKRSRERKARRLLATGKVVEAEITGISEDTSQSMNRRHPITVSCRYTAPDGRVYFFHSGPFWYESYEINPKKKVRVYVDRNNPANYYVDVSSVVG